MSINNYIKDLLNIKDKNIVIDTENIIVKKVKYIDTKFIYGKLTYNPKACPCCGHVNESFNIIKYGSKACKIKLPSISNIPTILFLKKQRFLCKECGSTFSAKTDIVSEFSNISNDVKRKIAIDLTKISSFKSIAESNNVSLIPFLEFLKNGINLLKKDFSYIPPTLSIDEFKSTKNVSG
ncbi:ISL3 family transposase, partial [Peptoniphilus lacrimalis]